jgi:polysaccharide export outer membrane protein
VLGQVNRPGRFPLERADTRLSEVLAAAGGIVSATNAGTASASGADFVVVSGTRDGKSFRREIDVPGMFLGDHPEDDIQMAAGDIVYVPPARVYYIYGEVQRPGSYVVTRGMTVQQALAQAGGPTPRGTERGLHIDRPGPDGAVKSRAPAMSDLMQANDVLYVPESLF